MKTFYLNKNIFDVKESCIITAPTGTGKSTALIEYITKNNIHCIIVSPLNELSMQLSEKSRDFIKTINSETTSNILSEISNSLIDKKPIIVSLKTFCKYVDMFYNIPVYIDECHKLIEYNELCETEKVINAIREEKFKLIVGITATPLGLDFLLNLKIITSNLSSKYNRTLFLDTIDDMSLESMLGAIYDLYIKHGKLVVMYNNKNECLRMSEELRLLGLTVLNYNSDVKDIRVVNEHFSEKFDILFCTSSLITGVSILDNYHAVCILRFFDTINSIPQFFSRNRNENSSGTILKTYYCNHKNYNLSFVETAYHNKTPVNISTSTFVKDILTKIKTYISKDFLEMWLEKHGNYSIFIGEKHYSKIELRASSKFQAVIEDQKDYFINNFTPKFDKSKYKYLNLLYTIYDSITNDVEIDSILKSYAENYIYFNYDDDGTKARIEFYDYFYPKIRQYHSDKAKEIASQTTTESIDVSDFEKIFKDKKYVKKEFKEYCMSKFALKKEVFKNKDSINLFLEKIGFQILHKRTGDYIIKIGD